MKIAVINGPNLNLLGKREPEIYGNKTLADLEKELHLEFPKVDFEWFQSNSEAELIDFIQKLKERGLMGMVINGAGLSHNSVSLADAVRFTGLPAICVHISNIIQREDYRQVDILATVCKGSIIGMGTDGYTMAIEALLHLIEQPQR